MHNRVRAALVALVIAASCAIAIPSTAFAAHTVPNNVISWQVPTVAGNQYRPAIYGFDIAYEDFGPGNSDITWQSLADNELFPIAGTVATDSDPSMWGTRIAWTQSATGGTDIVYRDGPTGTIHTLERTGAQGATDIWGDRIVFYDGGTGAGDIYMWTAGNWSTPRITPICTEAHMQTTPAIYGDLVVWTDYRNGNADIYMYNLATGVETRLTSSSANEYAPDIWGTDVVFVTDVNGNADVARLRRATAPDPAAADIYAIAGDQYTPSVWNERVVWASVDGDLWGLDPYYGISKTPMRLVSSTSAKQNPSIFGDLIAYGSVDPDGSNIWCSKINYPKLPLSVPGPVPYGGSATIAGALTGGPDIPLVGRTVGLEVTDAYGWQTDPLPPAITGTGGTFTITKTGLERNTTVRATFRDGAEQFMTGAGTSALIRVQASISKPSGKKSIKKNKYFTSAGTLMPWHKAGSSFVNIHLYRKIGGVYRDVGSATADLTDSGAYSRYSARFKLPKKGRWKIIATHSDNDHAWSESSVRYITVK
jgi:beta propeller repeat protein